MRICSCFHLFCKHDFFIGSQKRYFTNFLQIHTHRILDADAFRNGKIDVFHIQLVLFLDHSILIIDHQCFRLVHGIHTQDIDIALLQKFKDFLHLFLAKRKILEIVTDLLIFKNILFLFAKLQQTFFLFFKLYFIKFHRFPSFHTLFLFYPYSKEICSFCFFVRSSSSSFFSFRSCIKPSLSFAESSLVRFFRLSSFIRNIISVNACCLSS